MADVAERGAVVVTGASTGIGAATVAELARAGFVAFAGVRNDADAAAAERSHPGVRALRLDVTDAASISAAAETVAASGLPLRGLVNNAGVAVGGPLEFLPIDELRRLFEVNLFGTIAVTQAFMPALRRDRGRLVLVGSISGRLAIPFVAPYSASKFALRAFSDALRNELRPFGVAVSLIEPGNVKTPIWAKGRAGKERLLEVLPRQAHELYGRVIDSVFGATERDERDAMPVERVSAVIMHALTARAPRARYLFGGGARAGSILALLPAALRDRALRRAMRLP